jgi:predicted DNA-binding WGR domain protein
MVRFYRMFIAPNLFSQWTLFREWGRIGSGGQVKLVHFDNAGAALLALHEMVRLKKRRGYVSTINKQNDIGKL